MNRLIQYILLGIGLISCNSTQTEKTGWCAHPPRAQFSQSDEIDVASDWFKVYEVGKEVYDFDHFSFIIRRELLQ